MSNIKRVLKAPTAHFPGYRCPILATFELFPMEKCYIQLNPVYFASANPDKILSRVV